MAGPTLFVTDRSLATFSSFDVGGSFNFAAFVEPPLGVLEPTSLALLGGCAAGLVGCAWRRRRRRAVASDFAVALQEI